MFQKGRIRNGKDSVVRVAAAASSLWPTCNNIGVGLVSGSMPSGAGFQARMKHPADTRMYNVWIFVCVYDCYLYTYAVHQDVANKGADLGHALGRKGLECVIAKVVHLADLLWQSYTGRLRGLAPVRTI